MKDNTDYKLLKEVNPVFTTAQACLLVMAEAGDPDAKRLVSRLGFDEGIVSVEKDALTEMEKFQRMKSIPGFTTMIEARFTASSNLIRSRQAKVIIDLPCGYTPRGLQLARGESLYYGLDLPAVIGVMRDACGGLYSGGTGPLYHAVDATNYDSIRGALGNVRGELFITTEGLLMYLTQSELEEVFSNIARLLEEFGGLWVTTDNMIVAAQERMIRALSPGGGRPVMPMKTPGPENAFFDPEKAAAFVKRMGFSLEKAPVYDYLPDRLNTLGQYPEQVQNRAREVFRQMYFWIMKVDQISGKEEEDRHSGFQVTSHRAGDKLLISLQGRLDTITAPDLLSLYRRENEKAPCGSVEVDMKKLDYISSAGLRVLLIMLKDRPPHGSMTLTGPNPAVKEVLEATGFDTVFVISGQT